MAAIDKMYLTEEQFKEFMEWIGIDDHYIGFYQILFGSITFLTRTTNTNWYVSFNFDKAADEYLLEYCPLDFIQERLKIQYKK